MAKKEERESIDQLIQKAKNDLQFYNINMNIHNFAISENYRKSCEGRELNFSVTKKLYTKKTSTQLRKNYTRKKLQIKKKMMNQK